ncbi:Sulfate Permease (SulP) Family, partial [Pseudoloma neurophilia]
NKKIMSKFQQKQKYSFNIFHLISLTLVINIFQMIDMLSCGPAMTFSTNNLKLAANFTGDDRTILKNLGCLGYIYSTILAMVSFAFFTSIDAGIMAGPIVESLKPMVEAYATTILEHTNTVNGYYTNLFLHLTVTAIGFSMFSLLLYLTNRAHILGLAPKSVINGILAGIGLGQLSIGLDCIEWSKDTFTPGHDMFFKTRNLTIALVLAVIGYCILERYFSHLDFLIPLYFLCLIILFYIISPFIYGRSNFFQSVRNDNWIDSPEEIIYPNYIYKRLEWSTISWSLLFKNGIKILSMILLSSVHIAVNLPAYKMATGITFNFTKELRTQGLGNLFTFCPAYFICSYSIAAFKCGGKKRFYSIIGGASLIGVALYGVMIKGYIPKFALGLVPGIMFVGFITSAFFNTLWFISPHEYLISVLTTTIVKLPMFIKALPHWWGDYSYPLAFVFGSTAYLIMFGIFSTINRRTGIKNIEKKEIPQNTGLIVINHMLWFLTANTFENSIKNIEEKNIVIDLQGCSTIDWICQDVLMNACEKYERVTVIGHPISFRKYRFAQVANFFYFSDKQEYLSCPCE